MLKAVAMVGWSGSGRFEDLKRTVIRKLATKRADTDLIDGTVMVTADDPVEVARKLSNMPGVAWVAVGHRFSGTDGFLKNLEYLAKRYLSKGRTFRISAQSVRSEQTVGDLVLAGNSALLSSIAGAKVDERRPQVKFRVCMQGTRGACGVEIRAGPGGSPTGDDWVSCLVSGGERSSSLAWMAALSGFSLRLVHSRTDEVALRQVGRLYSELSFRMDASCLELVVLEGGESPIGRIGGWLHDHREAAFAGLRPERMGALTGLAERFPNLALPLVLVQDDEVGSIYSSLGLGRASAGAKGDGLTLKRLEARSPYSELKFGGVQADSNTVIDAMKRRG
jgi:hypothetical protein